MELFKRIPSLVIIYGVVHKDLISGIMHGIVYKDFISGMHGISQIVTIFYTAAAAGECPSTVEATGFGGTADGVYTLSVDQLIGERAYYQKAEGGSHCLSYDQTYGRWWLQAIVVKQS